MVTVVVVVVVVVALVGGDAARAERDERGDPLSLEEVIEATARRFPLVLAAEKERDVARGELLSAQGGFDPTLRARLLGEPYGFYRHLHVDAWIEAPTPLWGTTLFAGYRWFTGTVPVYDGKLVTNTLGELRAGLNVPLLRNGPIDRRRASLRRAEIGKSAAELVARQGLLDAIRAASLRYWDWVAAGRRLAVQETLLALATTRNAAIEARVEAGDLPAIERTDNARAIVQREAALVAARRALEQAAIELGLYVGDERGVSASPPARRLPETIPDPFELPARRIEEDTQAAIERRPEVRRLMAQRAQTAVELKYARNQLWPALDVTAQVSQDFGEERPPARSITEVEGNVFLDVPIPNRAAIGRIRATEAQLARTDRQAEYARDRILADVRDALSAMRAARERVGVTRREVALARELARAERQKFDLGDSTLIFVNLREQAAAEAAIREIDALADFQKAYASYLYATGTAR
jgi:outer membrane protein TolC